MDTRGQDTATLHSQAGTVAAAKMHILGLGPLKTKLGPKWERLSGLVHKLFKKAIANVQGPSDHFVVLDEMAYAVTFNNLSLAETRLICNAIAKEVCDLLFGDQVDEVSVRSMIADIVVPLDIEESRISAVLDDMLEQHGVETLVTHKTQPGSAAAAISITENRPKSFVPSIEQIHATHAALAQVGLGMGFFPVWELRSGTSNILFLAPTSAAQSSLAAGRLSLSGMPPAKTIELEIELLKTAAAYATRIRDSGKVCAVGVGVSYNTLSAFNSRIRYITAMQKVHFLPASPLVLKIEQVPEGAPDSRIGEMIAMLRRENVRTIVEFQSLATLPSFEIRLGTVGMGGALPRGIDGPGALRIAEKLVQRASAQKAGSFLDHIDTPELLIAINQVNVRLGTGMALSMRHFTGLEEVPNLPLTLGKP